VSTQCGRLRGLIRALGAGMRALSSPFVHGQPVAAHAAAPARAEAAQLAAKAGRLHSLCPSRPFIAVHDPDVSLEAGMLGCGIVALVTQEAVLAALVLDQFVSFNASLPLGGKVTLAAFEKNS
jgi:hypothetical protein